MVLENRDAYGFVTIKNMNVLGGESTGMGVYNQLVAYLASDASGGFNPASQEHQVMGPAAKKAGSVSLKFDEAKLNKDLFTCMTQIADLPEVQEADQKAQRKKRSGVVVTARGTAPFERSIAIDLDRDETGRVKQVQCPHVQRRMDIWFTITGVRSEGKWQFPINFSAYCLHCEYPWLLASIVPTGPVNPNDRMTEMSPHWYWDPRDRVPLTVIARSLNLAHSKSPFKKWSQVPSRFCIERNPNFALGRAFAKEKEAFFKQNQKGAHGGGSASCGSCACYDGGFGCGAGGGDC